MSLSSTFRTETLKRKSRRSLRLELLYVDNLLPCVIWPLVTSPVSVPVCHTQFSFSSERGTVFSETRAPKMKEPKDNASQCPPSSAMSHPSRPESRILRRRRFPVIVNAYHLCNQRLVNFAFRFAADDRFPHPSRHFFL